MVGSNINNAENDQKYQCYSYEAFGFEASTFKVTHMFVRLGHSEIFQTMFPFMIVRSCHACQRNRPVHSPENLPVLQTPILLMSSRSTRGDTPVRDQGTAMGASPYGTKEQQKIDVTLQFFSDIRLDSILR